MKILELNFESGWRGGERQTLYTLQGFREAGVTAHLICKKDSYLARYAKQEDFVVHSFSSVFDVFFFLIKNGKNYDFVHTQTSHMLTYCVLAKPFFKAQVWFTRRVNFSPKGFLTKLKYHSADKIIAVSSSVKDVISKFCGRDDIELISDIGLRTEPNTFLAKEKLSSMQLNGKYIIATTAALTLEKDPMTTIEVVKKLSEKRKDFVFLYFGAGDMKALLAESIVKNDLSDLFFMMGFVENVENFFPLFNVFIMTSQEEGLCSSVLDAFLYKVPVVSTNAGGLKELIANERGILCAIKDSDAIADGIDLILSNPAQKQKYIGNAYEYVTHYHSMKYIIQKYIDLMKTIQPIKSNAKKRS